MYSPGSSFSKAKARLATIKLSSYKLPLEKIRKLLKKKLVGFEEWRQMKVVILGNGQIGKSTFIAHLKNSLLSPQVWEGNRENTIRIYKVILYRYALGLGRFLLQ